jgi:hypothetical protein
MLEASARRARPRRLEVQSVRGLIENRRRFFLVMAPVLLMTIAIPAGRSDAAEEKVSPATVSEGLKTIQRATEAVIAAGADKTKAEEAAKAITPVWELSDATIRANDNDAYVEFEDALDNISAAALAGDAKQADEAARIFKSTAASYVGKFPERTASAAATPAPAPARRADAARTGAAPAPAEAGDAALARTGSTTDALAALAGLALALGGFSIIGGAGRRPTPRVA